MGLEATKGTIARMKYVWHDGAWREAFRPPPQPRIHIIRDGMEPLRHMATGEVMDSKSAYSKKTRELGYEEYGNDAPMPVKPVWNDPTRKADIAQAVQMVSQGYQAPRAETPKELQGIETRILADV